MTTTELAPEVAQQSVCPPACATIGRHCQGCHQYRNPHGKTWCTQCRRRVQVEDVSTEPEHRATGEHAWRVEYLACGHDQSMDQGVTGPAPGNPVGLSGVADMVELRRSRTRGLGYQEGADE